jgi:hypothetical protein
MPNTALTFASGAPPTELHCQAEPGDAALCRRSGAASIRSAHPVLRGVATVRLHYLDSELNGATEANLRLWRLDGSRWRLMGRSAIDTTNNYVELTGVTAFSDWAIAEDGEPTAVTVVDFGAELQRSDGVHLAWETADETLNAGFHILRSESPLRPRRADHAGVDSFADSGWRRRRAVHLCRHDARPARLRASTGWKMSN